MRSGFLTSLALLAALLGLPAPAPAAEPNPAMRLQAARAEFLATLPAPLPADPWPLRDPAADATRSAELLAYDQAIAKARDWARGANGVDILPRKGLWVRPYRRDAIALDVLEVMDNAQSLGITDLFVETFRGGRVNYLRGGTFPSRYSEDLLAVYVKEGQRRGIRIHAWLHTLDFGPDWAKARPDTLVLDGFGQPSGSTERGSARVSPALSEVHREVAELIGESAARGVDGVMLDYLRYPTRLKGDDIDESADPRNFFGYNLRQFEAALRRHPELATPEARDFLRTGNLAREEQREDLMARWKGALSEDLESLIGVARDRATRENVALGAAYFPDYYFHPHDTRVQESRRWAPQFDLLSPMCYQYYLDEYPGPYGTYTINRALEIADDTIARLPANKAPLLMPSFSAEVPGTPYERVFHHRTLREQTAFLKGRVFDKAFPRIGGVAYFSYGWIFLDSEARRKAAG
ncbi:MAG: hypothetical protein FJZ01_00465 [Candidatus Sericytochromatia bacterium]|nr:hypothetical protein [Candidatus Tanganyikabacteria bacterium]